MSVFLSFIELLCNYKLLKKRTRIMKKVVSMRVRTQARTTKQPIILPKTQKEEPKIINLAIHLERLTAQLSDGRELSIPIA